MPISPKLEPKPIESFSQYPQRKMSKFRQEMRISKLSTNHAREYSSVVAGC